MQSVKNALLRMGSVEVAGIAVVFKDDAVGGLFKPGFEDAFIAGVVFDAIAAEVEGSFVQCLVLLDNG